MRFIKSKLLVTLTLAKVIRILDMMLNEIHEI